MILLSGNGELENAPEEPNIFNVGSIRIPSPAADLHSTAFIPPLSTYFVVVIEAV